MRTLPKIYNPKEVEEGVYQMWERSGFFNPDNLPGDRKEPFVVACPPPNVTGVLHLGHALENAIMDIEVRFQRMRGKKTLLIPGTDHAAVATQARVEKNLIASGTYHHPREELGREKLLEIIREFAEQSKSTILSQMRKMGASYDWSRLVYTFDEQRSNAVNELFIRMYRDGLIYRGFRTVNWSVKGQSTCSDDELEYVERQTKLYTFTYTKDFPIPISTTRPETKLGDTAVAVNPNDARYKQYIGQTFIVDVGSSKPLSIRIIADQGVDPNFGTGAVGVTPAHSQIDYEMYAKRNGTPDEIGFMQVIGSDGRMTQEAGRGYDGLGVEEAREKFVERLRAEGLLLGEEVITQKVGTSDRFGDVVEVIPMEQWFIDVDKEIPGRGKTLKDLMREAVTTGHNGDPNQVIKIMPDRFRDSYLRWVDHLRDWCISRQIWWGHRIPVWYRQENFNAQRSDVKKHETVYVGIQQPPGDGWEQDPDTLDTWFSSGAWTFSSLGWPEQTDDLKNYHPTTWMQMGYEILFFWMARMILMSTYALDQIPFQDVYIHGMLRDEQGRKFSKSLGNGIDPIDACETFGTDALRLSLVMGITPGNDSKFSEERVEHYKHFINKFWNITRLVVGNVDGLDIQGEPTPSTLADTRVLSQLNSLIHATTAALSRYQFSQAAEALYEFTWHEFADWYLEIAKIQIQNGEHKETTQKILMYCLMTLLKLWHPFIPFVTEHIYQIVRHTSRDTHHDLLMVQPWPKEGDVRCTEDEHRGFLTLQSIISSIRYFRSERNVGAKLVVPARIQSDRYQELIDQHAAVIERMTTVSLVASTSVETPQIVEGGFEIFMDIPASEGSDETKAKKRVELQNYIAALESKLANKDFVARAPEAIVNAEQKKLEEAKQKLAKLNV